MRFRILDENHDWLFGKGRNDYATGSLAVAYSLKTKILSWYRDCFFDMQAGIDWKNILGSKTSKAEADGAVRKIITTETDVQELTFFESEITNRIYHCTAKIKTVYGDTIEVRI